MTTTDSLLLHSRNSYEEIVICFTVPSEANEIMKYLSSDKSESPLVRSFSSTENLHEYQKLLQIIHQLICSERLSFASDCTNSSTLVSSSQLSWISGRFPSGTAPFMEHRKSPLLHIETNHFFSTSVRAIESDTNNSVTKSKTKFIDFHRVQAARTALCRTVVAEDSRSARVSTRCIPIVVVVLQPSDFEHQCLGFPGLCLPLVIETSSKEKCASNVDAKATEAKKDSSYRVLGFPEDIELGGIAEENLWHSKHSRIPFGIEHICKNDRKKKCMTSDKDGDIYFVSSSFILHSFFFGRICAVSDFFYSPENEACIWQRDVLEVIIQHELCQYSSSKKRREVRIDSCQNLSARKSGEKNCTTLKRQREAGEESTAGFSSAEARNCSSLLGASLFFDDRTYVEKKMKEIRFFSLLGEPMDHLLKCHLYTTLLAPISSDDSSLLTGEKVVHSGILSSQTMKEEMLLYTEEDSNVRHYDIWSHYDGLRSLLQSVSLVEGQLTDSLTAERILSSSAVDSNSPSATFSGPQSTELVDLFDWSRERITFSKNQNSTTFFKEFNASCGNEGNSTRCITNDIFQRGKELATSFFAFFSAPKLDKEFLLQKKIDSSTSFRHTFDAEKTNYDVLLVLEVIRRRQDELSYILHLLNPCSSLFSISLSDERRKAYAILSAFWDDVANEAWTMAVYPSPTLSGAALKKETHTPVKFLEDSKRLTGKEAMLLYIKHFSSRFLSKNEKVNFSEAHCLAQWKSHLTFLLLYGSDPLLLTSTLPQRTRSHPYNTVESSKHQHRCVSCLSSLSPPASTLSGAERENTVSSLSPLICFPELMSALKTYRAAKAYAFSLSECIVAVKSVYLARWLQHAPVV